MLLLEEQVFAFISVLGPFYMEGHPTHKRPNCPSGILLGTVHTYPLQPLYCVREVLLLHFLVEEAEV